MCGICGYYSKNLYSEDVIHRMNEVITHRGPDSDGFFRDQAFNMAMRRLAIIDLNTGDQPIYNADASLCIVFNGEIYNYRQIKAELQKQGKTFRTKGDTEVILLGYELYGDAIFQKLNGMFGIAIYDRRKKEILLARDRLGIKPLYYYHDNNNFIFGSEIKSILQHPSYNKQLDYDSLNNLIRYKYILKDGSMFMGIKKVNPGSIMKVNHQLEVSFYEKFWKLEDYIGKPKINGIKESMREVEESIYQSVEKRLIADVPLGVFLSGGVDSAILTNVATEISKNQISTYSIGFDNKSYNELSHARLTADFNNTNHHELVVRPQNIMNLLTKLVNYIDEPLGDYAILPNYLVSKFAGQDVKVALSGAGADEIFGGYERYWLDKGSSLIDKTPQPIINLLLKISRLLFYSNNKKSFKRRLIKYLTNVKQPLGYRYDYSFHLLTDNERLGLLTDEIWKQVNIEEENTIRQVFDTYPELSFLTNASFSDLMTILPNNYLIKEDRTSMACSLEVRVPFLDHEVVQTAFRIKDEFKIKGFTTKYILKKIFNNRVHKDILNRPKQGFEVPLRIWLKDELKDEVTQLFAESVLVENKILNRKKLKEIQNQHFMNVHDRSKLLFTLIELELWYRQYFVN